MEPSPKLSVETLPRIRRGPEIVPKPHQAPDQALSSDRLKSVDNELQRFETLHNRLEKLQKRQATGKGGVSDFMEIEQLINVIAKDEKRAMKPDSDLKKAIDATQQRVDALGPQHDTPSAVKAVFADVSGLSDQDLRTIAEGLEVSSPDFALAATVALARYVAQPDGGSSNLLGFIKSPEHLGKRVEILKNMIADTAEPSASGEPKGPVDYSDFSHYKPTDPENMAPCPFTNAMVNQGFLPPIGMTEEKIYDALKGAMKFDSIIAHFFASNVIGAGTTKNEQGAQTASLKDFDKHNLIEHDASLTRADAHLGDNTHFSPELYEQLRAYAKDGYISKGDLARFRRDRENDSRARNPEFDFSVKRQFTAYGEAALLFIAMSDNSGKGMRVDWLDVLLREERFPVELGWKPSGFSSVGVVLLAAELRAMVASGWF